MRSSARLPRPRIQGRCRRRRLGCAGTPGCRTTDPARRGRSGRAPSAARAGSRATSKWSRCGWGACRSSGSRAPRDSTAARSMRGSPPATSRGVHRRRVHHTGSIRTRPSSRRATRRGPGLTNAAQLARELRDLGVPAGYQSARRYLAELRRLRPRGEGDRERAQAVSPPRAPAPSPRETAWLLRNADRAPDELTPAEHGYVAAVGAQCPAQSQSCSVEILTGCGAGS